MCVQTLHTIDVGFFFFAEIIMFIDGVDCVSISTQYIRPFFNASHCLYHTINKNQSAEDWENTHDNTLCHGLPHYS